MFATICIAYTRCGPRQQEDNAADTVPTAMLVVVLTFPPPHPLPLPLPLSRSPPHFPAVFRSGNNFKFNLRLFIYSQANATRESHAQLFSHIFGRGWGSLSTVISSCAHLHSASGARHTHPIASSGGSRHSTRAPSDKRRPAAPTAAAQFDASPCTVELALYWRHSLRIAGKQCNTPWGRCTQQGRKTDRQTDGKTDGQSGKFSMQALSFATLIRQF